MTFEKHLTISMRVGLMLGIFISSDNGTFFLFKTELLYGQRNIKQKQVVTQIAVAQMLFSKGLVQHGLDNSYFLQNFTRMVFFLLSDCQNQIWRRVI